MSSYGLFSTLIFINYRIVINQSITVDTDFLCKNSFENTKEVSSRGCNSRNKQKKENKTNNDLQNNITRNKILNKTKKKRTEMTPGAADSEPVPVPLVTHLMVCHE